MPKLFFFLPTVKNQEREKNLFLPLQKVSFVAAESKTERLSSLAASEQLTERGRKRASLSLSLHFGFFIYAVRRDVVIERVSRITTV